MKLLMIPHCAHATHEQVRRWGRRSPAERLANRPALRARDIAGHWNGRWSAAQWERLVASEGSLCFWCGERTNQPVPDHYIPLARGGRNSIRNLVVACTHCNSQRQDKLPEEYWAWLAEHAEERPHRANSAEQAA